MSGLIVLIPYTAGQEFYSDEYEYADEAAEENEYEEEQEEYNEEEDDLDSSEQDIDTYLPVYVQTENEDIALMAVAYAACIECRYVACPEDWRSQQEWKERGYPGTLNSPGVKLPPTEEAFEIPEPGDCFCCASIEDYEVYSLANFKQHLEISKIGYLMPGLDDDETLWQQFNDWCVRVLNYQLLSKKQDGSVSNLRTSDDDGQLLNKKPNDSVSNLRTLDDDETGWLD